MIVLFIFLIIDLDILIHLVVAKVFIPNSELVIPKEIQTNEANAEIEKNDWHHKQKQGYVESNLKPYTHFYVFHSLNHNVLTLL